MPESEKCIACSKPEKKRGLCVRHYNAASYRVNVKKETTWRKLEQAGLARPLKKTRKSKDKFVNAIKATASK